MYEYNLKISFINVKIQSNLDLASFINSYEPYNICINYYIGKHEPAEESYKIVINNDQNKKVKVSYGDKVLTISGDITPMLKDNYNKQFSLFGNKGIINRFFLHIFEEEYNAITLHGCAIKHPITDKIIIGIGPSGSGKSTFISNALKKGWKLIATEHVIIDEQFNIYKGNVYDNISPYGIDFIRENLKDTYIYENKKLIEPLGEKIFVNYEKYSVNEENLKLNSDNSSLIILNFKKDGANRIELNDMDFLLRMLQIASSEKIVYPLTFCNELVDGNLNGNINVRNKMIDKIMNSNMKKIILSGNYNDFENYVDDELKIGGNNIGIFKKY